MATQSKTVKKASRGHKATVSDVSKKSGTAKSACRAILTPTRPSTLGRARIKAAVTKVYGKKAA